MVVGYQHFRTPPNPTGWSGGLSLTQFVKPLAPLPTLGRVFKYVLFLPLPWEMIKFDLRICFQWVETTN